MVWDAEEAAARFCGFRGRRQAPRVPWLYGTVLYGWSILNSVALQKRMPVQQGGGMPYRRTIIS